MTDQRDTHSGPNDGPAPAVAYTRPSGRIAPRSPRAALEPERIIEPHRASRRARHPVVIIGNFVFTAILLIVLLGGLAFVFGKQRFDVAGPLEEDRIVNIPRGLGTRDIADLLNREHVIDGPYMFIAGVVVLKARDDLKFGEYKFTRHASLRDVIGTITSGKVVQHQITVAEGLTSEQIVAKLLENDVLTGSIKEIPREGTLLPESYHFTRGMTREQIIQRMQQAERKAVSEVWARRAPDLPLKTPDQLVVLASIVEKETGKAEERPRVAAVFVNRLKKKMRLQSDPTIIYGLVGGKGTLGRPIMKSEIEQPTPYNTYVIDGLPPGPIANPGRAALEAVANPANTADLFFVSDGTGGHLFSEKLDDHMKNVSRLRAIEKQVKDGTDKPAATEQPEQQTTAPAAVADKPAERTPSPRPRKRPRKKH